MKVEALMSEHHGRRINFFYQLRTNVWRHLYGDLVDHQECNDPIAGDEWTGIGLVNWVERTDEGDFISEGKKRRGIRVPNGTEATFGDTRL